MYTIRCQSKTEPDVYRHIQVNGDAISCCGGDIMTQDDFCSHIDAVIVNGERAMVHPDDRSLADRAQAYFRDRIKVPSEWKGSWRRERRWRGLAIQERGRNGAPSTVTPTNKPGVCFTGTHPTKSRGDLFKEAESYGWTPIKKKHGIIQILVLADPTTNTIKAKHARSNNIPMVTYEEWDEIKHEPFWTRGY